MVDSVIRGNPITRTGRYHLDGVLTDPTLPTVVIRDPLGVAVVTATPTRLSTGVYQYVYSVAIDALLDLWDTEWTGVLDGQSVGPISDPFRVLPVGAIAVTPNASYTYDLGTDVGKVRLLIQDHDLSSVDTNLPLEQRSAAFTDEELTYFLASAGEPLTAAAMAQRAWANSKQLIIVARKTGRTELDYGSIRADLLKSADALDKAAREQPADGYAEQSWTDFTLRQILTNEALRELP